MRFYIFYQDNFPFVLKGPIPFYKKPPKYWINHKSSNEKTDVWLLYTGKSISKIKDIYHSWFLADDIKKREIVISKKISKEIIKLGMDEKYNELKEFLNL